MDLFSEIEAAYAGEASLFDGIGKEDLIIAFFPCTRFESKVPLLFRGEAYQQKKWTDEKKLEYAMRLHTELHELYVLLCKLMLVAIRRGLRMVVENPYTQPHYLTAYFPIKPEIIDKDRTVNGDFYKKPTQYWFIGFEALYNPLFEPIEAVQRRKIDTVRCEDGVTRQTMRSMIHPQYAQRFIKQHLVSWEGEDDENQHNPLYLYRP